MHPGIHRAPLYVTREIVTRGPALPLVSAWLITGPSVPSAVRIRSRPLRGDPNAPRRSRCSPCAEHARVQLGVAGAAHVRVALHEDVGFRPPQWPPTGSGAIPRDRRRSSLRTPGGRRIPQVNSAHYRKGLPVTNRPGSPERVRGAGTV